MKLSPAPVVSIAFTLNDGTAASPNALRKYDLLNALCFFAVISALEFLVWLLFHKIDQQNAAQRAHILADCEAAGLSLPAFLAQELEETL